MARPSPRRRRRAWILGALLLLVAWVPAQVWFDVNVTTVARARVATPKLAPGRALTVFQVTDFHNLQSARQVEGIVAAARRAVPDVVALTGDLVETHQADLVMVERLLSELREVSPNVFYVRGNHDNWNASWGSRNDLDGLLSRLGIPVLDNTHVTVSGDFGTVEVLGTNDPYDGLADLAAASRGADPSRFWLLLTHAPEIRTQLPGSGVDLALCGHTHGGQVRLPFVGALYVPGQGWFPHHDKGMFDEWGGPRLWIDSGVGWTSHPVRFLDQSQVSLIEVLGG